MLPYILNIETSTKICSVSLSLGNDLLACRELDEHNAHSAKVTLFINEVLEDAGVKLKQVNAISVSKGPGSYTGLRIGVSVAKGLCYSLDIPLIAVNTLQAMACGVSKNYDLEDKSTTLFCPMIDARRMEVYTAIYDNSNFEIEETKALILEENVFDSKLENNKLLLFGDGAEKCKELFSDKENIEIISNIKPSGKSMIELSYNKFVNQDFEDVAYFVPFYLKDFVTTKSKKKLF